MDASIDSFLGSLSPADQASFSLGTFEGNANSKLTVQGMGGGYGITNNLTFYGFIPFYTAEVNMRIVRTAKGQTSAGSQLQLSNLPDVDNRLIQSLVVNYFGYKPLGNWKATDFGDAEVGFLLRLKKWKDAGLLMSMGAVIPTGKKDDPDILQDIAFGDGQWDGFLEFGGGLKLLSFLSLDAWTRLTYQFPYSTNLRLPDSPVFPVTTRKGTTEIKLGNKVLANIQANIRFSDQWMSSLLYSLEYKEADKYKSAYESANSILQIDTEKNSQIAKVNLTYSTLALFQQKKFIIPLNLNLSAQTIFSGKNVPYYNRYDFEIALYF